MASIESLSLRREEVIQDYKSAEIKNRRLFSEARDKGLVTTASEEFTFSNQKEDGVNVTNLFYHDNVRAVSIQKLTKVGADGLMFEIAKNMTTHIDDTFVVNLDNVRFITGMNNANWEKEMIQKAPACFKDKIFHHGKLQRTDLEKMRNSLIIADEIEVASKEFQLLHRTLDTAGLLDVKHMEENNNRFVFISATILKPLHDLSKWGTLHASYKMTIPTSYIGHKDFLAMDILKEFYPLDTAANSDKWVQEDIIDNYGNDYRVHLVRVTEKTIELVKSACNRKKISFRNHTSKERLSNDELSELFDKSKTQHIVVFAKGFWRRADLIPNAWKIRIGATHELSTNIVDNNVQVQGFPGRMTGYWRSIIESGHKTGPHRTSIKSIKEYLASYDNPLGKNSYQCAGFKKKDGKVLSEGTMLSPRNISNLEELPSVVDPNDPKTVPVVFKITPIEYGRIKKIGHMWDYSTIQPILKKYIPEYESEIDRIDKIGGKDQIVEAIKTSKMVYRRYIEGPLHAYEQKKPFAIEGNIRDKTKDTFQIYLDKENFRLIVSIYYGTRTIRQEE